ncbi:MAG: GIY-YIG nuclease family protein [Syntrophomonas sp.]|nr:GIY-YIG nuclease family protein [Syntrophomonas sp.]
MNMDRKKELKQQYKEIKINAGVYQVRNIQNEKVFITSTRNLKTINGKLFGLKNGSFPNKKLEQDLQQFGAEAFVFEVLEVLEKKEEGYFDEKDALKKLEQKWLERVQPFGERGYN